MEICVVDAFTDNAFSGNPAGVVLLDAPADASWMQSVAAEMKHAETAFVVVGGPEDEPKPLRWFTPAVEVDLCGHATLASAHVLGGDQRFDTRSGILTCTVAPDGWIEMDFPADPPAPIEPSAELVAGLPGITVEQVAEGTFDVLVQAASAADVRALQPDLATLAQVSARGVIVTAPGDEDGIDFVSRFFGPRAGVPEDPVTGSAHCTLAPWWAPKLGRTDLVAKQVSARTGVVRMSLREDRVLLQGAAVTVLRGELLA
jgi:predicted PhzF superfamily epimerase YddE/YHI9